MTLSIAYYDIVRGKAMSLLDDSNETQDMAAKHPIPETIFDDVSISVNYSKDEVQ